MKQRKYGNLIRIALFGTLTVLMLTGVLRVLNYKTTGGGGGWQHFYQIDNDSIDIIFFGSSHAHCTIDHGYLWDNYGIAGYTLSAGSQQLDSTCYFVKEALRTHRPQVIAVEMMGTVMGEFNNTNVDAYRNSLGMKWSGNLVRYVDYLANSMNIDNSRKNEILAKIPVVHSRYKELVKSDFEDDIPFMVGYRGSYEVMPLEQPEVEENEEVVKLSAEITRTLQEIIDEARKNGVEVVFFVAPFAVNDEEQMGFNAVEEYAKSQDVPFINYNKLYDEIGIDYSTDFRDEDHVNNYGAIKVTGHLASFLRENYELPDRRGDKNYKIWEDNSLYLRNKILRHELESAADLNEYLELLAGSKDEKTIIVALTGNYKALGDVYLDKMIQLGITEEEYSEGGVFVWRNGKRQEWLSGKEYAKCFSTESGEIHVESSIQLAGEGEEIQNVKLLINGNDYFLVENGVNMIVYEETLDQVIDAAGDDVYLGLELSHNDKQGE